MDVAPANMRAKARRIERQAGSKLGLIVVDYLQLMTSGGNEESRQYEMSAISRSLKKLAVDLEVPVLAVSQLSRQLESRTNKRPMLSDLRDSGAIEQDANVVMFLYNEFSYNPDVLAAEQNTVEVIVAKNRMGVTGTRKLSLIGSKASFMPYTGGLSPVLSDEGDAEAAA
jgi:replicative DNA helicase